ncbi:response regulator transcription factor [Salipaludibacillus daqingensis]|uniref:response regulator transcription factor n=1 Tax=Salipaludibacillus daqingensis TaxID=3041001 RepID=UPI002476B339|nr:response regulator transcription factor [Salipaludibacillus daqingensis]
MRVLIGMDHELLRYGLIQLIKDVHSIDSMVLAETASELVHSLKQYTFDLIVIDERLANAGGIGSVVKLMENQPKSSNRVMMYSCRSKELEKMVKQGKLQALFYEQAPLNDLMVFFQQVLKGEKTILRLYGDDLPEEALPTNLTKREEEILMMKIRGYSVVDSARLLNISPKTVENHRRNIRKKLNIKKNHQWFEWGIRLKMI